MATLAMPWAGHKHAVYAWRDANCLHQSTALCSVCMRGLRTVGRLQVERFSRADGVHAQVVRGRAAHGDHHERHEAGAHHERVAVDAGAQRQAAIVRRCASHSPCRAPLQVLFNTLHYGTFCFVGCIQNHLYIQKHKQYKQAKFAINKFAQKGSCGGPKKIRTVDAASLAVEHQRPALPAAAQRKARTPRRVIPISNKYPDNVASNIFSWHCILLPQAARA